MKTRSLRLFHKTILLFGTLLLATSCGVSRYKANTQYPSIDAGISYAGKLEECVYNCSVKGPEQRRMYVYLPPEYHEGTERYPVLYLLHGARGNEQAWIQKGDILHNIDSLTATAKMKKTIVVFPNVNQYDNEKDFGKSRLKSAMESFFETDGTVESAFVEDVVRTVDSLYRTKADKGNRAIAGMSIGAMQTIYISANAPETFDYIGIFSAMVHPVLRRSEYSSFYKGLKRKLATQFESPPDLYCIMVGKRDFYYPRMKCFCRYLEKKGYPFELYVSNGGHQWYNWEEYANIFMQSLWKEDFFTMDIPGLLLQSPPHRARRQE